MQKMHIYMEIHIAYSEKKKMEMSFKGGIFFQGKLL